MTFDSEIFHVQPQLLGAEMPGSKGDEKTTHVKPTTPLIRQKDDQDDFCDDTQISDWENEGGAYLDRVDAFLRNCSLKSASDLTIHMDFAEDMTISGDYTTPPHIKGLPLVKLLQQITP